MKRQSRTYEIALSAIACAVAVGFLMLGSLTQFLLATGYLVAAFAIMVPLGKNFTWGAALCALAAGLLALPVSLWRVVPYFVFFGLHPIVNYLQRRYVKRRWVHIVVELVKTVWFVLAMWLSYYVLTAMAGMVFSEWIEELFYYVLFLGGPVFFWVYDALMFVCQRSVDAAILRFRR